MNDNKSRKVTWIIVIFSIFIGIIMIQNYGMNKQIQQLSFDINNLNNNFMNMNSSNMQTISRMLQEELTKQSSSLESYEINYVGVDPLSEMVNLRLEFQLKESIGDDIISLQGIVLDHVIDERYETNVESMDGINYVAYLTLPYQYDYQFDLYAANENGLQKKLNTEEIHMYINQQLSSRTRILSNSYSITPDSYQIGFELENQTFGEELWEIDKVEAVIELEGNEIYRADVSQQVVHYEGVGSTIEYSNGKSQNAYSYQEAVSVEYGEIESEGTTEVGDYRTSITHEILIGKKYINDYESYPQYDFTVEVTYKNGETARIFQ